MHIHVPAMHRVLITIIKNMLSSDLECATKGLVCTACMRRRQGRPDTYSLTTSLRKAISNRNTKLMVETKTSPYMHDIELHFTKKKKGHKQEIKKISIEIKRM